MKFVRFGETVINLSIVMEIRKETGFDNREYLLFTGGDGNYTRVYMTEVGAQVFWDQIQMNNSGKAFDL